MPKRVPSLKIRAFESLRCSSAFNLDDAYSDSGFVSEDSVKIQS